jgi:hypothetical protein
MRPAMTAENKLKSTKEKKRQPAPPEEFVEYVIEITEWFWKYSLSLSSGRYRDHDPYLESRDLQITGKLLRPTGLKTEGVQISMRPSSGMNEERRKDYNPIALGALDLYPRYQSHNWSAEKTKGPRPSPPAKPKPSPIR